jgi:protein-tyrosine phosphatase
VGQFALRQTGTERGATGEAIGQMDMTWVTDRIAVGGGIWVEERMAAVAEAGVTHVIDMQIEFDDTPLGKRAGVKVLWNPVDDDFQPKDAAIFERGVRFALDALEDPEAKLFVHCAAGIHRAPMMALAVLCALGYPLEQAKGMIQTKRYVVDFADVYVRSVEEFLKGYRGERGDGAMPRDMGRRRK